MIARIHDETIADSTDTSSSNVRMYYEENSVYTICNKICCKDKKLCLVEVRVLNKGSEEYYTHASLQSAHHT